MNSRQAKKRAKQCYYLGIADAFLRKMAEVKEKALTGEFVDLTLKPVPIGLGHNTHHFSRLASFGKYILKKYKI